MQICLCYSVYIGQAWTEQIIKLIDNLCRKYILADFFKHAFDGGGADNFFDAGSCIGKHHILCATQVLCFLSEDIIAYVWACMLPGTGGYAACDMRRTK